MKMMRKAIMRKGPNGIGFFSFLSACGMPAKDAMRLLKNSSTMANSKRPRMIAIETQRIQSPPPTSFSFENK